MNITEHPPPLPPRLPHTRPSSILLPDTRPSNVSSNVSSNGDPSSKVQDPLTCTTPSSSFLAAQQVRPETINKLISLKA